MSNRDKANAEPTNDARADRVMQLLWMYADGTGQRVNGQYTDELATIVQDVLSDLLHYCDREELDFSEIEESAFARYWEEQKKPNRHSRNPKTIIKPEQLFASGRQGTTGASRLSTLYAELLENILTDSDNPACQGLWEELQRRGWEIEQTLPGTLSNTRNPWALNTVEARTLGLSCDDGNQITVTAWKQEPLGSATISPLPDHGDNHGRAEAQQLAGSPSFPYLISVVENNERTQFRACLTREQHTAIELKLHELQDADDIETFNIADEEGGAYLTFAELADTIHDTYSCGQQPEQIISDRTAKHYTDPAS